MKRLLFPAILLLLSGCAGFGGEVIKDYTNRSTVFGWVNIDDVDGNHLYNVIVKQYKPKTDKPYYFLAVKKFKGGHLFYTHAMVNGKFKLDEAQAQSCLGIFCGNTYYTYSFGSQGSKFGTAVIKKPGVYYLGSYDLLEHETGFFEQSKFDIADAKKPPTKKEMLEEILKDTPSDHPIVAQRIRKALGK